MPEGKEGMSSSEETGVSIKVNNFGTFNFPGKIRSSFLVSFFSFFKVDLNPWRYGLPSMNTTLCVALTCTSSH